MSACCYHIFLLLSVLCFCHMHIVCVFAQPHCPTLSMIHWRAHRPGKSSEKRADRILIVEPFRKPETFPRKESLIIASDSWAARHQRASCHTRLILPQANLLPSNSTTPTLHLLSSCALLLFITHTPYACSYLKDAPISQRLRSFCMLLPPRGCRRMKSRESRDE